MKIIKGNLLEYFENGDFDVIIHGCNCFHCMSAGIAKQISLQYPLAFEVDLKESKFGDRFKLGTYTQLQISSLGKTRYIVNAYTQFLPGGGTSEYPACDYDAIRNVFKQIYFNFKDKRIGYPMIGCGIAGGDWNIVSAIIDEELKECDHTLVKFQQG